VEKNKLKVFLVPLFFLALVGCSRNQTADARLEEYAKAVSKSFHPANDVAYRAVTKTMDTPLVAYLVRFETSDSAFKSMSDAATNRVSFMTNTARRLVWEAKFCTGELHKILVESKVNLVSGEIMDEAGHTQFIAMCPINKTR
jgi:hypothetical protein